MKPPEDEQFWLEVEAESLFERCDELRATIAQNIPHEELYTLSGEVDFNTRWGAVLWTLNKTTASFRALGF